MKQDAFSAGVEPGGLWHKNDIRILLCYILSSVPGPLARQDLTQIIQEKGLANYFEVEDALASLAAQGNVKQDGEGCFTVTPAGREIADSLDATLPLSVRDKALEAAFTLPHFRRRHGFDDRIPVCAGQGPGQTGETPVLPRPGKCVQGAAGHPHRGRGPCQGFF